MQKNESEYTMLKEAILKMIFEHLYLNPDPNPDPNFDYKSFVDGLCNYLMNMNLFDFINGLTLFFKTNENGWINDDFFDINLIKNTTITFSGQFTDQQSFDFKIFTNCISVNKQYVLWEMCQNIMDKDKHKVIAERTSMLQKYTQNFVEDMAKIGYDMTNINITDFVNINKNAIKLQNMDNMSQTFAISKENLPCFWGHLRLIYNLVNPFTKIEVDEASNLISSIFNNVSSIGGSDGESNGNFDFNSLLSGNFIGNIMKSLGNIQDPKNFMSQLVANIPDMPNS